MKRTTNYIPLNIKYHLRNKQMDAKERALQLRDEWGWNVLPLKHFKRNYENGLKDAPPAVKWQRYQKTNFSIDKHWRDEYKAIAIMTGETSNITIIDIDSEEKALAYEKTLGKQLHELCGYIIKTYKGYQLFYLYNKKLTTKIMGAEKTDVLSGTLTFADPYNDSYEIFHDDGEGLADMPEDLYELINQKLEARNSNSYDDALSQAIREDSDLPFRYPMAFTINEFLKAKIIGKNLNDQLKNIFYSKDYEFMKLDKAYSKFSDCAIKGEMHNQLVYFGSLVAASPTIDRKTYKQFMTKLHQSIFKLDIEDDAHEANLFTNRINGNKKYWRYVENWMDKHNEIQDEIHKNYIERYGLEYWVDSSNISKKYKVYDSLERIPIESRSLNDLRNDIIRLINRHKNGSDELTPDEIKEIKTIIVEDKLIERRDAFDVNQPERFFTNDEGNKRFNLFYRRGYLLDILEDNLDADEEIPPTIKLILDNVFPVKEEQDRFLHDLAYHMKNLHTTTIAYVIIGAPGTGKNRIVDSIIKPLYGRDFYHQDSAQSFTSRFRGQFKNKLAINLDEVKNQGPYNGGEQGSFYNTLKRTLANETISLEGKGTKSETVDNNGFYILTSNDPRPFVMEDKTDRRFNFIHTNDLPLDQVDGYPSSIDKAQKLIESELSDFVAYLTTIKLSSKLNKQVISNEAREFIFKASETPVDNIINAIKANDPDICNIEAVSELLRDMYLEKSDRIGVTELSEATGKDLYKKLYTRLSEEGYQKKRNNQIGRYWVLNPGLVSIKSIVDEFDDLTEDEEL